MGRIRSKDTTPEMRVRKFLFAAGFRYRLHQKDLPGCPDIVLPKYKTVIFVHGCFWHGHPCKIGSGKRMPQTNIRFWNKKIQGNIYRGRINRKKLLKLGWTVLAVWECKTFSSKSLDTNLKKLFGIRNNYEIGKTKGI